MRTALRPTRECCSTEDSWLYGSFDEQVRVLGLDCEIPLGTCYNVEYLLCGVSLQSPCWIMNGVE